MVKEAAKTIEKIQYAFSKRVMGSLFEYTDSGYWFVSFASSSGESVQNGVPSLDKRTLN